MGSETGCQNKTMQARTPSNTSAMSAARNAAVSCVRV
jgi:hypothetical protein